MAESKKTDQEILQAIKYVQDKSLRVGQQQQVLSTELDQVLQESDAVLSRYADCIEEENQLVSIERATYTEESFADIVQQAAQAGYGHVGYADILSSADLQEVISGYDAFVESWEQERKLDQYDWMATGAIASLAVCVNFIVVGEGTATAGKQLLTWLGAPTEHVPNSPKVSFDKTLSKVYEAAGNHRWNSISHHPTPGGFIHAIRDVLNNTSTHIVNGEVLIADNFSEEIARTWTTESFGSTTLARLLTAGVIVLKHWWSDVNTSLGLPGPFMMLAKFLEFGAIEYNGQSLTIADLAQRLFDPKNGKSGLDMRRFLGDSMVVLLCEVLTRLWFFCRAIYEQKPIQEAFRMLFMHPKLQTALLTIHGTAVLCNAGTVYISGNPLCINTAQWMAFGRYLLGYISSGLTKDGEKNMAHQQLWVQKMRTQYTHIERHALHADLQNFTPVCIG